MTSQTEPFTNLNIPTQRLPKIGERVRVICIKEMIFVGNLNEDGGEWLDDGHGKRGIMFWEEIK